MEAAVTGLRGRRFRNGAGLNLVTLLWGGEPGRRDWLGESSYRDGSQTEGAHGACDDGGRRHSLSGRSCRTEPPARFTLNRPCGFAPPNDDGTFLEDRRVTMQPAD